MSDEVLPVAHNAGPNALDTVRQPTVPSLDQIPDYSEDDVLALTRKIRIRQLAIDLNNNGGELSADPEERKIQLALLKDLDGQAVKIKMIGAKEKASAVDREAAMAVHRMLDMMGDKPMRREPIDGESSRSRPSIRDAQNLKPLELAPDETQVGVDSTTYDELMERTGNG
jgi:hypothetical protein